MGGIAGCIQGDAARVSPGAAAAMAAAVAHRGATPMVCRGDPMVALDGAIANAADLRRDLETLGHRFPTGSDAETLLAAYRCWGAECLHRLRGLFAFALWDPDRGRLLLGRDHFGGKPLFLWQDGAGGLVFGSEIKALLAHPRVPARLDRASVRDILTWGYVPGPHTLFADIRKLPPAHWAMWQGGRLSQACYWAPPDAGERPARTEPADPVAEFLCGLDGCVGQCMAGDVPAGAFLSGGVNSAAVVALMSRHAALPVETFSAGWAEAGGADLLRARQVAECFRTRHHELTVPADELLDALPVLTAWRDAPVAAPADLLLHHLAQVAAATHPVMLAGAGADALLGGRPRHRAERWAVLYRRVGLPAAWGGCRGLADPRRRYPCWSGALSPEAAEELLAFEAPDRPVDCRPFLVAKTQTPLRRILAFDQASWLPDHDLERCDRMTMAAGVQARLPFVDPHLAMLLARLPDRWRVSGLAGKRVLRLAMAGTLPREVLRARDAPEPDWLRRRLRFWAHDLLRGQGSATRDWYRPGPLARLLEGPADRALWLVTALELFQRHYRLD